MTNDINGVYWYFYAIIGLYLITPVLTYLTDHPAALRYAIILSALVTVVFPTLWRFGLWPSGAAFSIPYLGSWLTYYLLGYYLVHNLRRTSTPSCL